MTLMKSILLGSAAGIVAVAGAQAADLPTKKAAPAEYVKICNVGGMAGFIIPGSDTCLKISGYVSAQYTAGNLGTQYNWASNALEGKKLAAPLSLSARQSAPGGNGSTIGFDDRLNLDFDARQMTAYGVLRMYASVNIENSSGYEGLSGPGGAAAYIDQAYIQWAGITAGKAPGFFAFYGGGEGWFNLYSPDQQGYNEPDLLAYTATFGGGFSATIAAQSSGYNSPDGGNGTNINYVNGGVANTTNYGMTAPDIVANIRVDQAWGSAQLSGVAHQVHVLSYTGTASQDTWGWGINGGVKFNLPTFGPGDNIQAQASYTQNAMWFSGIPDTAWVGGPLQMNGNGLAPTVADTFFAMNPKTGATTWATPTSGSSENTGEK